MKYLILLTIVIGFSESHGQVRFSQEYDHIKPIENDSSKLWIYELRIIKDVKDGLIGEVNFKKIESLSDSSNPSIAFKIYKDLEEEKAEQKSLNVKMISSCVTPNIGGDLITLGNVSLINEAVCLRDADHCRMVY